MSSGACRALVAVLFTLVATIVPALPVAAQDQSLDTISSATYQVRPNGTVRVDINVIFTPRGQRWAKQTWEQLVVEERATPRVRDKGFSIPPDRAPVPGLYQAIGIATPAIKVDDTKVVTVRYDLKAADLTGNEADQTPARLDSSYMYLCVTGQETQTGSVSVDMSRLDEPASWQPTLLGSPMEPTTEGFESTRADRLRPGDIFTCFEAVRPDRLEKRQLFDSAGRAIELQAWESDPSWLDAAEEIVPGELRRIRDFLDYDIPGEGTVIVRMAPSREIGGYASAHSTPGIVQLDEGPNPSLTLHEMAHAWFGTDNFLEIWLREGMAEWTASSIRGRTCAPSSQNTYELDLSNDGWLYVQPQTPPEYERLVEDGAQEAAACGLVSAVAARMPEAQFREVIGSMLLGETKYVGTAGPEPATSTNVTWMEWLDAIDERGLVPAAKADPAYAANLQDLDFAQNLLAAFGIPQPLPGTPADDLLALRSEARAKYHDFLDYIDPLGPPKAVREDMDDWDFETAMSRIDKSIEVYDQLTAAAEIVPEADLVRAMQPLYERADDELALEQVAELVDEVFRGAQAMIGPLSDLVAAQPPGWTQPAAIVNALGARRFDDAMNAIGPAIEAVQKIGDADAALPEAGFLEKYRPLYENATSVAALEDIVRDASTDSLRAGQARGRLDRLAVLAATAGDWTIPPAVATPLGRGDLRVAVDVMDDAIAVIEQAIEADETLEQADLRAEFRPKFEEVQTGAQMEALLAEVTERAGVAIRVGEAISVLDTLVPTWNIPGVVEDPVEAGDFAGAIDAAEAAKNWVQSAYEADQLLKEIDAMGRTRDRFEAAQSLEDLQVGAELAAGWANAASWVNDAINEVNKPRSLLTDIGLWGENLQPEVDVAVQLAIEGRVEEAIETANKTISTLKGAEGAGSLRLAGIVFFGVAVLGVLGLWVMLRRQAGPSWARSTKPHWVEDEKQGGLFGRRKKQEKGRQDKGRQDQRRR